MASNVWIREMDELLVTVEQEVFHSLRKINGYFKQSGQSFDDKFERSFLQMLNDRYNFEFANYRFRIYKLFINIYTMFI